MSEMRCEIKRVKANARREVMRSSRLVSFENME